MALALPLVGITVLTGYLLNKDESSVTPRSRQVTRTDVVKNDIPNGLNIYHSNKVNEANNEVLQKSLANYKDAENPSVTAMLPPLFNTYGANGNTSILTNEAIKGAGAGAGTNVIAGASSSEMNKINEMNRRINVLDTKKEIGITNRPMFNPIYPSAQPQTGTSDFKSEIDSQNTVNPLTGLPYETNHKNMVPFFGGSIKQNVEKLTNTSVLDLYTGKTDSFIHKKETKPFYTLMKQDINGTPSVTLNTDMDRYIPSNYKQSEKPFYEERFAKPKAGTVENDIRVYGKTPEELRVASNPKLTYEGRTLSGQFMSVRGIQSQVNKNLVDTHYENTPDRWLKTTGAITGESSRDNFVIKPTSRQDTTESYFGNGHSAQQVKSSQRVVNEKDITEGSSVPDSIVRESTRQSYSTSFIRNYNPVKKTDVSDDYGKNTYTPYVTERELNGETNQFKLNVSKQTLGVRMHHQDDVRATIKQTTLSSDNSGNMRTHDKGKMTAVESGLQNWEAKATNKQALVNNKYIGAMKKDEGMGYTIAKYIAKTTSKEIISANSEYTGNSSAAAKNAKIYSTYQDPIKTRNVTSVHYTGSSAPVSRQDAASRQNYNNAEINDRQETLLINERPSGPQKFQISSGVDSQGTFKYTPKMQLKEESSYRKQQDMNEFLNSKLPHLTTPLENIGLTENRKETQSEVENTRLQPMLIRNQLQNNPFVIDGPNKI